MATVAFKKGLLAALPSTYAEGTFYVTTDERAMYILAYILALYMILGKICINKSNSSRICQDKPTGCFGP